jgi:uncharacterized protein with HEPN domain
MRRDDAIRLRPMLVHAYSDINLDILWQTVQDDRPMLVADLARAMPGEANSLSDQIQ